MIKTKSVSIELHTDADRFENDQDHFMKRS
jgi:hypothetical protein